MALALCYRYHLFFIATVISLTLTSLIYQSCRYSNRKNPEAVERKETDEIHSTCSAKADQRGFHQHVIAYSIYGDFSKEDVVRRYLNPMMDTVQRVGDVYPGWIARIYHNASTEDQVNVVNRMFGRFHHVDLCNATRVIHDLSLGDIFAMTWRFLPMLDPMVDRLMSRDADSPLLQREVVAVQEWLNSNETFHVLRDHPGHCVPMLGGDLNFFTIPDIMKFNSFYSRQDFGALN